MRFTIVAALLLGALPMEAAVLDGPLFNPATGHFYSLLTSNTWMGAQAEALAMGGNLTTIDNAAENDWVFDTFSAGQSNLWIGLRDPASNGVYAWVDGTAFTYSNWDTANGQPNGGNEHWVFMVANSLGHGVQGFFGSHATRFDLTPRGGSTQNSKA